MSFKVKTFLVSFVLSGLIYFLMFLSFSGDGHFMSSWFPEGGARVLMCLVAGLALGFVTCIFIFLFSKNVKNQNEIMTEFEANGISDRYIALLQNEVNRGLSKSSGQSMTQVQFNYVIQLADAYLMRRNINASMNTINLVGPAVTPKLMDPKKLVGVSNLLKYYDIQISLCEQMHAPDRANNIMNEAMPIILKYQGKQQFQDLVICETLCIYNLLIGRYDDALRSVEFCERYNSRTARFLNNVQKVRIYSYLRDMNSAYQFYNAAAGIAEKKNEQDILAYLNSYYLQSTEFGQN